VRLLFIRSLASATLAEDAIRSSDSLITSLAVFIFTPLGAMVGC
jgi:hypothetical protein